MVKRRRFTPAFKQEAVKLLDAGRTSASKVAIDLGIVRNQLYKWKAGLVRSGKLSPSEAERKPADHDSEIAQLKRKLVRITEERDVMTQRFLHSPGR